jgi:hypothetical protein
MMWVSKIGEDKTGLVSGGRVMVESLERQTGEGLETDGSEVRCGWAEGETRQDKARQLTRVRGGGGEVVRVVLLLVLVLHEAIVEVWRRRSGVRVVLTGIVRVWCRLGLVLALAVLALALAVLALAV